MPSAFRLRCTDIRSNRRRYSANASGVACDGAPKLQVTANQLVDALLRQVDVRIAQQRRQIVGVGPHARVLEIDDVQAAIVQHQIAAVIVAMAQHARLARELVGDRSATPRSSASRAAGVSATPRYASRKCLTKKFSSHISLSRSNAMP